MYLVFVLTSMSCKDNSKYHPIQSMFYYYNVESPSSHAPNMHLVEKVDGRYVEIAEHVFEYMPLHDEYLIYIKSDVTLDLYVHRKGNGQILVRRNVPGPLSRAVDGISYDDSGAGGVVRKTINLKEVENLFK